MCPDEVAEGKPSIGVIDNDDCHNDTLTGGGTAHYTNWMFLQHLNSQSTGIQECEANVQGEQVRIKDAKTVSQALTEKTSDMQAVTPYKTIKRGEPPIRPEPITFSSSTEPQQTRCVIHALARADVHGDRPDAAAQTIPFFNGFHAVE